MAIIDNLIGAWELGTNGNDSHSNGLTLTNNNTVTFAGGWADFESGSVQDFTRTDEALLSTGDIDFTGMAEVQLESKSGAGVHEFIASKYSAASGNREYAALYHGDLDAFRFGISADGTSGTETGITATTFGAPSTGTPYTVFWWHDSVNNLIGIAINAGTADTLSHSAGVFDSITDFSIGSLDNVAHYWDGLIRRVRFWKRVLAADERTWLYNSGSGRSYADIVAGMGGGGGTPFFTRLDAMRIR
jgi:hypothetical protein